MRGLAKVQDCEPAVPQCQAAVVIERDPTPIGTAMPQGADEPRNGRGSDRWTIDMPDAGYPAHVPARQTLLAMDSAMVSIGPSRGATTGTPYLASSSAI